MEGALKKQILMAVELVFLYSLVDQLKGFEKMNTLNMLQHLFSSYGATNEIDLEGNALKMMGPSDPAEPLA